MSKNDPFGAAATLNTPLGPRTIYRLDALGDLSRAPYSIRVLLESVLRNLDGRVYTPDAVRALAAYDARHLPDAEIAFMPARVVLQDFTGVPAVVDLAAMRSAIVRLTGDPNSARRVNPLVPCDLVIDHSVQVDAFNSGEALKVNANLEFQRNRERYELLKWAQQAFDNFRVVPPATGIVHQVNLEYLAQVVWESPAPPASSLQPPASLLPDSLVGTDSHTTMINGLGVLGWGVGGIEAEAVMLGQPIFMLIPQVVGFRLTGDLPEGATATDLVLRVTQMLRAHGVVGRFVEFFGPGLDHMPVANRATIANMAPEYGATVGFFPVDDRTLEYLRLTGRGDKLVATVEQYYKAQGLWRTPASESSICYASILELDLAGIEPSLAGPRRPQDRIPLSGMKSQWAAELARFLTTSARPPIASPSSSSRGPKSSLSAPNLTEKDQNAPVVKLDGDSFQLPHGSVVIAAITSCTNTSNPSVMVAAGLLAKRAHELGLQRKPWVKTSLAPGSKVVTEYLDKAGLSEHLEAMGFYLVGYGCTTCIGNSGPLPQPISKAINDNNLVVAAVLSGNRNFEARISPDVRANYLASPPLVVAYAIAGTVDIDMANEPLGKDTRGRDVYLRDLWPTQAEIAQVIAQAVDRTQFVAKYADVFAGGEQWRAIEAPGGQLYEWKPQSTYVQEPPFFVGLKPQPAKAEPIRGARCLVKVGDSVTTDHISPAGSIKQESPAGRYLMEKGVRPQDFNSYGSRRGNDRVMTRGTFANVRMSNDLANGREGWWTMDFLAGEVTSIFDAAEHYRAASVPLVVLAGNDYGMGSSRDWAAKGTYLLGVRAVLAESFERIHRSNLVGMGVLPLTYREGENARSLGLTGTEVFDIDVPARISPRQDVGVVAHKPDGKTVRFRVMVRIDTPVEIDYYRHGGILQTVLRRMAARK